MKRMSRVLLFLALFAFLANGSVAAAERTTPIGAAKVDITPDYGVRLSGYGNRRTESEGVAERIWAKALAIGPDENEGPAVLVTVENCGITREIRQQVAQRLQAATGVQNDRFVISASHTHTAPCLTNSLPFLFSRDIPADHQERIDRYTRELTEKLLDVAVRALANRQQGRLWWSTGNVGFAKNRRGREFQPVDHSLPVLVAKNESDRLIAIVANYACHCTTLGGDFNKIAGDWAGYAQQYLEQDNPGAVALITIGCGADANPAPRGGLEVCQLHGRELASEVQRLLKGELQPLDVQLQCRATQVDLPYQTAPSEEELRKRAEQGGPAGYHATQFLKQRHRGEQMPESISYPVATWTFGDDLAMVFLGGEVVVDYSIRLKSELDAQRLWVTAYANDVPCYIPSKRILREGGYEAESSMIYYARPTRLATETEDIVVDTVLKLLPQQFYSVQNQRNFPPPKSPSEGLASLQTTPGVIVELVASEPLIADPVAFDWGPDGRLWVAEMRDYPNGMGWNRKGDPMGQPGGRIKVLRDDDGDGRYDRSTVFLDGIAFPSGVKVWRKGILVTAAPEIFYAEDTDGDDVADRRETLYRGFGEGNQQHRVNGMRWGLDNWIYLGNGDSGGTIKSLKTGESLSISGRDLRIRPDQGLLETRSGQTQFGRSCDDFGNWFGGNNSNPMWHYVLDDYYLRRNPNFAPPNIKRQVSVLPGAAPVFPTSRTLARFNDFDKTERFTSACSPIVFRDASRRDQQRFAYVCEPVHNLVHREVIEHQGVTFTSRRAESEQTSEFLSSDDNWFRPVMVRTGPAGALWIADMYRFVIEHPTWVPAAWQRKLDLRAGDDRGRIYRVRLPGIPNSRDWKTAQVPRLDKLDTAGLVAGLDGPNGTRRDMLHQLLLWGRDPAAVQPLKKLVRSANWPPASIHALYLLAEFNELDDDLLARTIRAGSAAIARHAIRLAEGRVSHSTSVGDAYLERMNVLSDDAFSQQEKLQLAYSLGFWDDPRAAEALAQLALYYRDNDYIGAAVLSSINDRNLSGVMQAVLATSDSQPPPRRFVTQLLATAVAYDNSTEVVDRAVAMICQPPDGGFARWQLDAIVGLLDALDKKRTTLARVLSDESLRLIAGLFAEARRLAADVQADTDERMQAIRLLGRGPSRQEEDSRLLARLLSVQTPPPLQLAAVRALRARVRADTPDYLLRDWNTRSPTLRAEILDVLQSRTDWTTALLKAIEQGDLPASSIDPRRRQQLSQHKTAAIRATAATLFATGSDPNRQAVVQQYQQAVHMNGDLQRGKQLFKQHCGKCHRLEDAGHSVGPDLVALTDKTVATLLVALLDPNRAVEDKFLDYVALTDDGRQHTGMIISETGNSITLAGPDSKQSLVLRSQLDEFRSTGKSLMPDGLEKELAPQGVADVIAYVRAVAYPPKQLPGNTPRVAPVRDDGSIRLFAMHGRIYGPSLTFEEKHRNLGSWTTMEDHAIWDIEAPRAGTYRLSVSYACGNAMAGNRFLLSVAGQTLGGTVDGSGGRDDYRSKSVGTVQLPTGRSELLLRSDGPIQGTLMDLRSIQLTPLGE